MAVRMGRDIADKLRSSIKEQRVRRRISQTKAAAMVGRTRKWLSEYERGNLDPATGVVFALAHGLGVVIEISLPAEFEDNPKV